MSRPRNYPRIGSFRAHQRPNSGGKTTCDNCEGSIKPGDWYSSVDIEFSRFRGDDDIAEVCRACEKGVLNPHRLITIRQKNRKE